MLPPIKPHRRARSEKKNGVEADLPRFRAALTEWFRREGRDLPWRHTYDPYAILVSEIMLQQTQVATVIDYYCRWLRLFPDPAALAAAPEEAVLSAWQGLGYYSRARNLHRAAKQIVELHGGVFPTEHDQIRALPGVGRYTAGAVATFAFDQPTPPVDGNIARVLARLIDFREPVDTTAGLEFLWQTATRWQPESGAGFYNEAMMELGALICSPRAPKCAKCPVQSFCSTTAPESLPVKKPRAKTIRLDEHCGWVTRKARVLLEQQTGSRWKGMWRLPLLRTPGEGAPLVVRHYPFTNHRITLSVFAATEGKVVGDHCKWFSAEELKTLPMTAPHRRALETLQKQDACLTFPSFQG